MKSPTFDYVRPDTIEDALSALNETGVDAVPLAGGQSLVPMMNFRLTGLDRLVDLNRIEALNGIRDDGVAIRIGAMTRYLHLMADPLIRAHLPLFGMALPHIAHPAIRNRGTIGGSLSLADPAAEMPALFLALGGRAVIRGPGGPREIAADDFFLGLYETDLQPGELLVEAVFPKAAEGDRFAFHEIARRHGDYAMAGVAVAARGAPAIDRCRISFFGVSDRPVRARQAESSVLGQERVREVTPDLSDIDFAGDLNGDAATKRHLAGVALQRALGAL